MDRAKIVVTSHSYSLFLWMSLLLSLSASALQNIHRRVFICFFFLMHPDGRIPVIKSEWCRSIGSQLDKIRMNLPRQESSRAGIPIRSWGQIEETKSRIWRKCGAISAVTWSRHIFSCFLAARPLTHVLDRFSGPRLRRFNFGLPGGGWGTFYNLFWMHQVIHLLSKRSILHFMGKNDKQTLWLIIW